MTIITILYVLLMIAALAWLIRKIKLHIEQERGRESQLDEQMFYDTTFKSYIEAMKKGKTRGGSGDSARDPGDPEPK
jgi:hypothetical protein